MVLMTFLSMYFQSYLTKWRADWRCRSRTSISFGLGQYAWPSRRWDPSIGWCCHSIAVLASLIRACLRPCPPVDLFAGSHVRWHAQKISFLYRFNQQPFGTCDTNHFLVRDASCPAYSQHTPQGPHFECFRACCDILLMVHVSTPYSNVHQT